MRLQSKSTMRYMFKNFLHFLPLIVLPAIMLSLFMPPFGPVQFFDYLFDLILKSPKVVFSDFHSSLYQYFSFVSIGSEDFYGINAIWLWLSTVIVSLIGMCTMFSFVERHIKYGDRSYGRLLPAVNETFLSVVPFALLVVAFYEIWMLLLSVCILLLSVVMQGILLFVFCVIFTIIFYLAFFVAFAMLLLAPPCMFFDGYKFSSGIAYSFQLVGANLKDALTNVLLNVLITTLLLSLYNFVIGFITNTTVATIAYYVGRFLFYLWWMLYLPCFSCCKYADYTETHRADLKIKMF